MVSFIVPVYNAEDKIRTCIDSILNQTNNDLELILVDDGSTDKSGEICEEYKAKDGRIKVVHKTNGGVSSARNTGLDLVQGEWFAFCDADDYYEQDFLENAISNVLSPNTALYFCSICMDYLRNDTILKSEHYSAKCLCGGYTEVLDEFAKKNIPIMAMASVVGILYRTEVFKGQSFDESITVFEDECFVLDCFLLLKNTNKEAEIIIDNKEMYHYRKYSSDTLSMKFHREIYDAMNCVHTKLWDLYAECKDKSFECEYCLNCLLRCIHYYFQNSDIVSTKEKYNMIKRISENTVVQQIPIDLISQKGHKILLRLLKNKRIILISLIFAIRYLNYSDTNKSRRAF